MIELALVALVAAAAAVAAVALVRRRPGDGPDTDVAALVEAHVARLTETLGRQALDDQAMRHGLDRTRAALDELRVQTDERRRSEEQAWAVVSRLEAVLQGGSSRGRAGENLLEEALSMLPPGILVRDFATSGKRVEFALVLPNGRRLPVDSKWTAVRELEALEAEEDPAARHALGRRVEEEVARRAREVACYIDASMTTPFAVACVPDAAFAVCRKAHADAFARGVVVVPYTGAVPTVLGLYALAQRYGDAGDVQACLAELDGVLQGMEQTLENKVAKATTMLENATLEWRMGLGKARGALARGRGARPDPAPDEPVLRSVAGGAAPEG
ncbi:MAG: DNA recombination protein RmuC [Actinomycetota bacterium]